MGFFGDAYTDILKHLGKEGRMPSASIKPSSLFCQRKMVFELLQVRPERRVSPEAVARMEDGKAIHEMVQQHFDRYLTLVRPGWVFQFELKLTPENNKRAAALNIRCSVDAYASTNELERRVLEIKQTSTNAMATLRKPKPTHQEQLNTYLYLLDATDGEFLYFDRSDLANVKSFDFRFDQDMWDRTEEKIHRVLDAAMEGRLPPTDVDRFWCRDCPYTHRCDRKEEWVDAEAAND